MKGIHLILVVDFMKVLGPGDMVGIIGKIEFEKIAEKPFGISDRIYFDPCSGEIIKKSGIFRLKSHYKKNFFPD